VVALQPADCTQLEQVFSHPVMHMVSVMVHLFRHDDAPPPKHLPAHCCSV
jgi:hypothetical protein